MKYIVSMALHCRQLRRGDVAESNILRNWQSTRHSQFPRVSSRLRHTPADSTSSSDPITYPYTAYLIVIMQMPNHNTYAYIIKIVQHKEPHAKLVNQILENGGHTWILYPHRLEPVVSRPRQDLPFANRGRPPRKVLKLMATSPNLGGSRSGRPCWA